MFTQQVLCQHPSTCLHMLWLCARRIGCALECLLLANRKISLLAAFRLHIGVHMLGLSFFMEETCKILPTMFMCCMQAEGVHAAVCGRVRGERGLPHVVSHQC